MKMVDMSLVIVIATLLSFFMLWSKSLFLDKIVAKRTEILNKIETDTNDLLENYKNYVKHNKREFILDLKGLYDLEERIKEADAYSRDMLFSFFGILILTLIYSILGFSPLLILLMIIPSEICVVYSIKAFLRLNTTVKFIEKYETGGRPRDFVKRSIFGRNIEQY